MSDHSLRHALHFVIPKGDRRVPSYLAYVVRPDDPVLQDRPGPELGARRSNVDALREA